MLRAILFDFNGVLVDDEPLHLEALQRVLREEGLQLDEGDYYRYYVGLDDRTAVGEILRDTGRAADDASLMRLVTRKAAYYRDRVHREGFPFTAGAVELVEAAVGRGLPLGVVSGALREEVEAALAACGLRPRFKALVTAGDVRRGKPDAEPYRRALELLNTRPPLPARMIHPHEVLAIEDTPAGLAAASAAGVVSLGLTRPYSAGALAGADMMAGALEGIDLAQLSARMAEVAPG